MSLGLTSLRMLSSRAEDDALALVADVEQHFVIVDLDDGAVDELAVLDFDEGAGDRIGEGHAEIVGDDLAGGVVALFVERAEHGAVRREEVEVSDKGRFAFRVRIGDVAVVATRGRRRVAMLPARCRIRHHGSSGDDVRRVASRNSGGLGRRRSVP